VESGNWNREACVCFFRWRQNKEQSRTMVVEKTEDSAIFEETTLVFTATAQHSTSLSRMGGPIRSDRTGPDHRTHTPVCELLFFGSLQTSILLLLLLTSHNHSQDTVYRQHLNEPTSVHTTQLLLLLLLLLLQMRLRRYPSRVSCRVLVLVPIIILKDKPSLK